MFNSGFGPLFQNLLQQSQLQLGNGQPPMPFEGGMGSPYKNPAPFQPRPFEGGMGGPYKSQPGIPGWGQSPFQPILQQMFARPEAQQWLQGIFGGQGLPGMVSGGQGSRGPMPSPFAGLGRFAGPFGNGGGPMLPSLPRQFGWGGNWQRF